MASPGEGQYRLNLEEKSEWRHRERIERARARGKGIPAATRVLKMFCKYICGRAYKQGDECAAAFSRAAKCGGDRGGSPGVKTYYSTSIRGVDLAGGSKGEMKSNDTNSLVQEKRCGSKERDSSCVYSRTSTKWP